MTIVSVDSNSLSRRCLTFMLVLAEVFASLGLPIPAIRVSASRAGCAGRACGCSVMEKSLGMCCCSKPSPLPVRKSCCPIPAETSCCSESDDRNRQNVQLTWVRGWNLKECRGQGEIPTLILPPTSTPPILPQRILVDVPEIGAVPSGLYPLPLVVTPIPSPPPKCCRLRTL